MGNNKDSGFVPLYRSIKDHWTWNKDKEFDEFKAWCDLLLSVNHKEKKISINGRLQVIRAGQMWTSYQKLADTWNWSRPRVLRYIRRLKSDGMVTVDGTPNGTLLTVVNWGFYNSRRTTNVPTDVTTDVTTPVPTDVTTDVTQTIMNNNVKNDNNVNKKDPAVCPGKGWYWDDKKKKWIAPPREGGTWQ